MLREILFEFRRVGVYIKVSAIDPVTNTEVSIVGPANAPAARLKKTAADKLRYVLEKKRRQREGTWV